MEWWDDSPEVAHATGCAQPVGGPFRVAIGALFDEVQHELEAWVDGQYAAFPTRPGIDRDAQRGSHLSLAQIEPRSEQTRIRSEVRPSAAHRRRA